MTVAFLHWPICALPHPHKGKHELHMIGKYSDLMRVRDRLYCCRELQENVTAVLTRSPTDVLSHVAIRARSQGVLLATCFDEAALGNIKQLEGKNVQLDVDATGAVTATESAAPSATDCAVPKSGMPQPMYVNPCMGIPFVGQDQGFQGNGQGFQAKSGLPKGPRWCILLSRAQPVVLSCVVLSLLQSGLRPCQATLLCPSLVYDRDMLKDMPDWSKSRQRKQQT